MNRKKRAVTNTFPADNNHKTNKGQDAMQHVLSNPVPTAHEYNINKARHIAARKARRESTSYANEIPVSPQKGLPFPPSLPTCTSFINKRPQQLFYGACKRILFEKTHSLAHSLTHKNKQSESDIEHTPEWWPPYLSSVETNPGCMRDSNLICGPIRGDFNSGD